MEEEPAAKKTIIPDVWEEDDGDKRDSRVAPPPVDWEARWRRQDPTPMDMLLVARPPHLDAPPPQLEAHVLPERQRVAAWVEEQLACYDESEEYPRPEDRSFECRDGFEVHVQSQASREVQNHIRDFIDGKESIARAVTRNAPRSHAQGTPEAAPIVLIALMAVHIATEGRLNKLMETLRSIQDQQLKYSEFELLVAVSWYAEYPALAAKVQQAFNRFIQTRAALSVADGCSAVLAEAKAARRGRGSFSRFAAAQAPTLGAGSLNSSGASDEHQDSFKSTLVTRQTERQTQFQHYRAALAAAESELRRRWRLRSTDEAQRSIWIIFGDDDDLWHSQRAAEFARAIRSHPQVEGVAIFATLTRAGVGLLEGQKSFPDWQMPSSAKDVDRFLTNANGVNHADEEACKKWKKVVHERGDNAGESPMPPDLNMEHFDFCPRLRIMHEFFDTTAPEIIAHRFCDLRLVEYMENYPRMGQELGLELALFEPRCWMYFYRNPGISLDDFTKGIDTVEEPVGKEGPPEGGEEASVQPRVIFAQREHVSAEMPVDEDVIHLAEKELSKFEEYDQRMTVGRLARHLAAFQSMIEQYLVRLHTRKIDQRRFDGLVVANAESSFGSFAQEVNKVGQEFTDKAAATLFKVCQDFARKLASKFGVEVLWHLPDTVIVPMLAAELSYAGGAPPMPPLQAGIPFNAGLPYKKALPQGYLYSNVPTPQGPGKSPPNFLKPGMGIGGYHPNYYHKHKPHTPWDPAPVLPPAHAQLGAHQGEQLVMYHYKIPGTAGIPH